MVNSTQIKVFDNDFNVASFQMLNPDDITGVGRIKPLAARHFAEKAQMVQNLTNLTGSALWQTVQPHFSSVKLAKTMEDVLDLKDYEMVMPFVTIAEHAQAQTLAAVAQQQVQQQMGTATGMGHDFDVDGLGGGGGKAPQQAPFDLKRPPPAGAEPGGMLGTQ
jgi:hypothetical protein